MLFNRIELEAQYRDLCIVIFVHGWKHNDAVTDTNVVKFRGLLQQMAEMELQRPPGRYWPTRKVVGIYVEWRALSFGAGDVGQDLTFWTRMATAHRVAEGSVREVLRGPNLCGTRSMPPRGRAIKIPGAPDWSRSDTALAV